MSARIPPPAAWLETQFDRAVRLRTARTEIYRRLATTTDPHHHAALRSHLDTVTAALARLGAPE